MSGFRVRVPWFPGKRMGGRFPLLSVSSPTFTTCSTQHPSCWFPGTESSTERLSRGHSSCQGARLQRNQFLVQDPPSRPNRDFPNLPHCGRFTPRTYSKGEWWATLRKWEEASGLQLFWRTAAKYHASWPTREGPRNILPFVLKWAFSMVTWTLLSECWCVPKFTWWAPLPSIILEGEGFWSKQIIRVEPTPVGDPSPFCCMEEEVSLLQTLGLTASLFWTSHHWEP